MQRLAADFSTPIFEPACQCAPIGSDPILEFRFEVNKDAQVAFESLLFYFPCTAPTVTTSRGVY